MVSPASLSTTRLETQVELYGPEQDFDPWLEGLLQYRDNSWYDNNNNKKKNNNDDNNDTSKDNNVHDEDDIERYQNVYDTILSVFVVFTTLM